MSTARKLLGRAPAEARHLHGIEREGASGETPFLAIFGVSAVVVLPVFLVILGLSFAAYYLT